MVADHLVRRAFHQHSAVMDDISAVDDIEGLANVMIGDQNVSAF